jgi:hypothetical protein
MKRILRKGRRRTPLLETLSQVFYSHLRLLRRGKGGGEGRGAK